MPEPADVPILRHYRHLREHGGGVFMEGTVSGQLAAMRQTDRDLGLRDGATYNAKVRENLARMEAETNAR